MRSILSCAVGVLASLTIVACGDKVVNPSPPPGGGGGQLPSPSPSPTPTPTPTPAPTMTGFWLVESGQLQGYGVEISESTATTFRGRAVFPIRNLTGPTQGSVTAAGAVRYDTTYGAGDFDAFEGQLDASRNSMTGSVSFILRSVNFQFDFNGVTMVRQR